MVCGAVRSHSQSVGVTIITRAAVHGKMPALGRLNASRHGMTETPFGSIIEKDDVAPLG